MGYQKVIDSGKFSQIAKDGDKFRGTYFLGYKVQKAKLGGKKAIGQFYSRLKCPDCDRIFRNDLGVSNHAREVHGKKTAKFIPSSRRYTYSKPLFDRRQSSRQSRKKSKKVKYSDDSDIEEITDNEDIEIIVSPTKQPSTRRSGRISKNKKDSDDCVIIEEDSGCDLTVDLETAEVLATDPAFNPKVELRDIYEYNETAFELPPKPSAEEDTIEAPNSPFVFIDPEDLNAEEIQIDCEPEVVIKDKPGEIQINSEPEVVIDASDEELDSNLIREPEAKKDYVRRVRNKSASITEINDSKSKGQVGQVVSETTLLCGNDSGFIEKSTISEKSTLSEEDGEIILID